MGGSELEMEGDVSKRVDCFASPLEAILVRSCPRVGKRKGKYEGVWVGVKASANIL